jgi:citronellyl-CoA dehydrogenase
MALATTEDLRPSHDAAWRHPGFTDEHELLRQSVRSFAEKELAPHADEWEQSTFPDSVIKRAGELGFLGLSIDEQWGGQGGDLFHEIVFSEELTHANAGGVGMGIGAQTAMVNPLLKSLANDQQKDHWLRKAVSGELIGAFGITEPDAGSDVAGIKTHAVKDGDEWVINGSKMYITNGVRSDFTILVTKTDPDAGYDGFSLIICEMDRAGVSRSPLKKLGMHSSDTALMSFDDVRVPAENLLGEEGKGFYHTMWELQGERLAIAAGCVAGAQKVFDRTLQFAKERQAFGRPIGNFQVIRHKFAEMATQIESAKSFVYNTALLVNRGEYPVREITAAKLHASRVAMDAIDECLQIHGGAGYMQEYGIERAWRDMRLFRIGAGTDEIMLDVIGRSYGI